MHRKIYRLWVDYSTIIEVNIWLFKLIEVKPNPSLPLKMHNHRAEHLIIFNGTELIEKKMEKNNFSVKMKVHLFLLVLSID